MISLFDIGEDLDARFRRHYQANPAFYGELRDLALELKRAGHQRCGVKMLFEVIRWRRMMTTTDPEGWKVNNSFSSRYARLLEAREPELVGFFELRELRS